MKDAFEYAREGDLHRACAQLDEQIKASENKSKESIKAIVNSLHTPYIVHQAFPDGAITKHTLLMLYIMHAGGNLRDQEIERKIINGVRKLVQMGANLDIPNRVTKVGSGWTCLFWAVYFRMPALVETILDLNANVNYQDHKGRTALHIACGSCSGGDRELSEKQFKDMLEIIRQLVDYGINTKVTDHCKHKASEHLAALSAERRVIVEDYLKGQYTDVQTRQSQGLPTRSTSSPTPVDMTSTENTFALEATNAPMPNDNGTGYEFTSQSLGFYSNHPIADGFYSTLQNRYTKAQYLMEGNESMRLKTSNAITTGADAVADAIPIPSATAGIKLATQGVSLVMNALEAHETLQLYYLVKLTGDNKRFFDWLIARLADRLAMTFAEEYRNAKYLAQLRAGKQLGEKALSVFEHFTYSSEGEPQALVEYYSNKIISIPEDELNPSILTRWRESSDELPDKSRQPILVESGEFRILYHPVGKETYKIRRTGRVGPPKTIPTWFEHRHLRIVDSTKEVERRNYQPAGDDLMLRYFTYRLASDCVDSELPKLLAKIPDLEGKRFNPLKRNNMKCAIWKLLLAHKIGGLLCSRSRMAEMREELSKVLAICMVYGKEHHSKHPMLINLTGHDAKSLFYSKTRVITLTRQTSKSFLETLSNHTETEADVAITLDRNPSCWTKLRFQNFISQRIDADSEYSLPSDLVMMVKQVLNRVCVLLHESPENIDEETVWQEDAPASQETANGVAAYSAPQQVMAKAAPQATIQIARRSSQSEMQKQKRRKALERHDALRCQREEVMAQTPSRSRGGQSSARFFGDDSDGRRASLTRTASNQSAYAMSQRPPSIPENESGWRQPQTQAEAQYQARAQAQTQAQAQYQAQTQAPAEAQQPHKPEKPFLGFFGNGWQGFNLFANQQQPAAAPPQGVTWAPPQNGTYNV